MIARILCKQRDSWMCKPADGGSSALNLGTAASCRLGRISGSQRSQRISTFPQWQEQQIKGRFRFCATNMLDRPPNAGLTAQASEARSRSSMIIRKGTALLKNGILSEGHDQSGNSDAVRRLRFASRRGMETFAFWHASASSSTQYHGIRYRCGPIGNVIRNRQRLLIEYRNHPMRPLGQ